MDDDTLWRYFPLLVGLPTWLLALTFLTRTVRDWPGVMQRWNEGRQQIRQDRQHVIEVQWQRLQGEITRLEERGAERDRRIEALETSEEDCRRKLASTIERLAEVEGYMTGQGKARQDAARIVAVERLADREEKGEGGK